MNLIIKFNLYCAQNDNTILNIPPHKYSLTKLQETFESSILRFLFFCLISSKIYMYNKYVKDGFLKMVGCALGYGILMLIVLLMSFVDTAINFAYKQQPWLKYVYDTLLLLLIILAYYRILMKVIWIVINSLLYNLIKVILMNIDQAISIKNYQTLMKTLWFIDILGNIFFVIHVIINYICHMQYKNHPDYLQANKEYEEAKNKAIKEDEEAMEICNFLNKNKIKLPYKQT